MPTSESQGAQYYNQNFFWHPVSAHDRTAMTAMRAMVEPDKGRLRGIGARAAYDGIIERVAPSDGVTYRPDTI